MKILYQVAFETESTTVGNSTALLLALAGAAAGVGLPLYRRWDGLSMAAVTGFGLAGVVLFQLPAIMATGNDVTAVVVDGETVAGTVSTGIGVYAAIAGSALLILAGGAGLLGAIRNRLGS